MCLPMLSFGFISVVSNSLASLSIIAFWLGIICDSMLL